MRCLGSASPAISTESHSIFESTVSSPSIILIFFSSPKCFTQLFASDTASGSLSTPIQRMPYSLLKSSRVTGRGPQPIKARTSISGEFWIWTLIISSYLAYRGNDSSIFQGSLQARIFRASWVSCRLKKMSVTGVNSRKYGADHRVVEYGLTEIVRYVQMPEFIQFGEYFVKIGEIKLSNPIQIHNMEIIYKSLYSFRLITILKTFILLYMKKYDKK